MKKTRRFLILTLGLFGLVLSACSITGKSSSTTSTTSITTTSQATSETSSETSETTSEPTTSKITSEATTSEIVTSSSESSGHISYTLKAIPEKTVLFTGETTTINVVVTGTTYNVVNWVVENPEICSVNSSNEIITKKEGTTLITGYLDADPGVSDSFSITVIDPIVQTIKINAPKTTLEVGESIKLTTTITGTEDTEVIWESFNKAIATIDDTGVVQAQNTPGTCVIRATLTNYPDKFDEIILTVIDKPVVSISITSFESVMYVGDSQSLSVSIVGTQEHAVTWSSSYPEVAAVQDNGTVKALEKGQTKIRATLASDPTIYDEVDIEVLERINITLSTINDHIFVGEFTTINATVTGATDTSLLWSSDNDNIATVNDGQVEGISEGEVIIRAKSVEDLTVSASITIFVSAIVPTIEINYEKLTILKGDSTLFTVSLTGASQDDVVWTSSLESVATINDGVVTAINDGTTTIKASLKSHPTIFDIVTVRVISNDTVSVGISTSKTTIDTHETLQLSAIVSGIENEEVEWSVNNDNASITDTGLLTPLKAGTVKVTASLINFPSICDIIDITIIEFVEKSISIVASKTTLEVGESITLTTIITGTDDKNVTWSSDTSNYVTVEQDGTITALQEGSEIIRVKLTNDESIASYVVITVVLPKTIEISAPKTTVEVGESVTLSVNITGTLDNGVIWDSSNNEVAIIDNEGVVTAIGAGSTTITGALAIDNSIYDELIINVVNKKTITITTDCTSLEEGKTVQLSVSITGTDDTRVAYTCDSTNYGNVSDTGLVTATLAGGNITVRATLLCDTSKYSEITILTLEKVTISLTADSNTVVRTKTIQMNSTITGDYHGDINWSVSNDNASVNESGLVTANKVGTVVVTAKLADRDDVAVATFNLTILEKAPTTISIVGANNNDKHIVGQSVQLTVSFDSVDVGKDVVWSTDSQTCTITQNGYVTFTAAGNAHIIVTSAVDSNVKADINFSVYNPDSALLLNLFNTPDSLSFDYNSSAIKQFNYKSHVLEYFNAKKVDGEFMNITKDGFIRNSSSLNGIGSISIRFSGNGTIKSFVGYQQCEEREIEITSGTEVNISGNYFEFLVTNGNINVDEILIFYSNNPSPIVKPEYRSYSWNYSGLSNNEQNFSSVSGDCEGYKACALYNDIECEYYVASADVQFISISATDTWSRVGIGNLDLNDTWHGLMVSPGVNGNEKKTVVMDLDKNGDIYDWSDGTTDRSQIWWGHDIQWKVFYDPSLPEMDQHSYKIKFNIAVVRHGLTYYYFINNQLWWKESYYLEMDGIPTRPAIAIGQAKASFSNLRAAKGQHLVEKYLETNPESKRSLYEFYNYSTKVSAEEKTIEFLGYERENDFRNYGAYSIGDAFSLGQGCWGKFEYDFVVTDYNRNAATNTSSGDLNNFFGMSFTKHDYGKETRSILISQKTFGFTAWNRNYAIPQLGAPAFYKDNIALDFTGSTIYHVKCARLISDITGNEDYWIEVWQGNTCLNGYTWGWETDSSPVTISFNAQGITGKIFNLSVEKETTGRASTKKGNAQVVLLLGQSNMEGHSHVSYLPTSMGQNKFNEYVAGYNDNISIAYFNVGQARNYTSQFVPVTINQGLNPDYNDPADFRYDPIPKLRFGPELGIGEYINSSNLTEGKVFLVKSSCGSTNLHWDWKTHAGDESGWLYTNALIYARHMITRLKNYGYSPIVKAACWMQGENDGDGHNPDMANAYYENTKKFVSALRYDFHSPNMGFIDAGIANTVYDNVLVWGDYKKINDAKSKNATEDVNSVYFSTNVEDGYSYFGEPNGSWGSCDRYHHDSASMIKLGRKFGELLLSYFVK